MTRYLALSTVAASVVAFMTSSCGDSGTNQTNSGVMGAGGSSGSSADGSVASGGALPGGGGSTGDGRVPVGGGGSTAGAGGSSAGSTGTGGAPPVPCTSDGDCSTPNPHCDTAGAVCVQCLADANCPNGETCNTTTHRCVECQTSGDCPNSSPYCDPDGRCVDCLTNENCAPQNPQPGGPTLVCSQQSHTCIPGCTESSQCQTQFGQARVCDTTTNQCVQCVTANDCNGGVDAGRPFVCTLQHTCTLGCNTTADCAQNQTRRTCDTATHLCVQCSTSADCGQNNPYCFTGTGTCVACLTDANCANSGGVCNQQFHFCGCTSSADCPQGMQCNFNGRCF
jgi:Cys-rich repeat protein